MPQPRDIELWSYLIGLGPIGEPVRLTPKMAEEDLHIRTHSYLSQMVTRLIQYGVVRRDHDQIYTVLRRIGDEGAPPKPRAEREPRYMLGQKHFEAPETSVSWAIRRAKLEEIPQDTRDLTAQLLGDPIPGDPRRPWQGASA